MADNFPRPYLNQTRENDPIVIRVNQDTMDIGARPSGLPKDVKTDVMGLDHVGGKAGSR